MEQVLQTAAAQRKALQKCPGFAVSSEQRPEQRGARSRTEHREFTRATREGRTLLLCAGQGASCCGKFPDRRKFPQVLQQTAVQSELSAHFPKQGCLGRAIEGLGDPTLYISTGWPELHTLCWQSEPPLLLLLSFYTELSASRDTRKRKKNFFFIAKQGRTRCSHSKHTKHARICQSPA